MADDHLFRFDLDRAIRDQLIARLEASPFLSQQKSVGPQLSGIYALYLRGTLVYVGKASRAMTKSGRDLRTRLNEHVAKISGRRNLTLADMTCRYLTFESEWWLFAAEFALIAHYKPSWNNSGFGAKIPGRGRPGTERVALWDQQFPRR